MEDIYKRHDLRPPDWQYHHRLSEILSHGTLAKDTPQGVGALTCFGTLSPMIFDLSNGIPLITERNLPSWRSAVAEIIAFINGARTIDDIESYGVNPAFWSPYRGQGARIGFGPDDMGPGSYGPAFHDFEVPGGGTLNQFEQLLEQIRKYPSLRTHLITPWKPYYTARGKSRRVIVAPCHGWLHFRLLGDKLHMRMDQRSADMPIGVPHNMVQYAALLLMVCQVTGYQPGLYIHSFADAHIYENQVDKVRELLAREPRPFPRLLLHRGVDDLFKFRIEHFAMDEYNPHPGMKIPYAP
ncbi:MAG: thymidylate synthase [Patescibacteria group bacterium]|nr:thymidylate synthase [Patescibacteria group bacterium]